MTKVLTWAAPTFALIAVTALHAAEAPKKVHYADVNVKQLAGIKVLYGRLEYAAGLACGDYSAAPQELARAKTYRACIAEAVARAVDDADLALLTQYATEQKLVGRRDHRDQRLARK